MPEAGSTIAPSSPPPAQPVSQTPRLGFGDPAPAANPLPQIDIPEEPANTPDPLPVTIHQKSHKGRLIGLIVAAVVLLLSGGAAAAYYYVFNTPENILKAALANTLDASKNKTLGYSGSISSSDESSSFRLDGTYEGGFNTETGALKVNGKLDIMVTNLAFELRSLDGKAYYFKLGGLEGLSSLIYALGSGVGSEGVSVISQYAPFIDAVNNQWIEINRSLIDQVGGSSIKSQKLSQSDRDKIKNAYQENSFLVIKQKLADESIKGASSYHYRLGIDKTKLEAFVEALKAANLESIKITDDQLKEINRSIDAANYDSSPVEVWISKKTKMFTQFSLKANDQSSSTDFKLTIDSYNQPFTVEKPAGSKSLLELIGEFFGGSGANSESMLPGLGSGISL
jgi:hypothetical protein